MFEVFLIGVGGFIGSIARYLVYLAIRAHLIHSFPLATLLVNTAGCLILGFVSGIERYNLFLQRPMLVLISVGLIGGFTTFSAFSFETIELIRTHQYGFAMLNIFCNLILGFGAILLGRWLVQVAT